MIQFYEPSRVWHPFRQVIRRQAVECVLVHHKQDGRLQRDLLYKVRTHHFCPAGFGSAAIHSECATTQFVLAQLQWLRNADEIMHGMFLMQSLALAATTHRKR